MTPLNLLRPHLNGNALSVARENQVRARFGWTDSDAVSEVLEALSEQDDFQETVAKVAVSLMGRRLRGNKTAQFYTAVAEWVWSSALVDITGMSIALDTLSALTSSSKNEDEEDQENA
jgi:hypothetical protein